MANLNKVMIIGNLTADPEVRTTPRGTSLTELRLAVNRISNGPNEGERREEVTYLDVTCWGRQGEVAAQYLYKGRSVFIEGRLQMDQWEDKQTGQKRSRIRVIAENLQLLGSPRDGGQQGGGNGGYQRNNNYGNGGGYQQNNNYNNGGGYGNSNNYGNNGGGYGNNGGGFNRGNGGNGGNANNGGNGGYQQQAPAPQPQAPAPQVEDDDIPF